MYNLCSQHLQSLNSVQQKLFVLQLFKDMFQMRPPTLQADLDLPAPGATRSGYRTHQT